MSYLKLMKLMYLAEKQFLLQHGERLTGDKMVSMPRGPVLSSVYDCFCGGNEYWDYWINNPGQYNLVLNKSIVVDQRNPLDTFDELSVAEQGVLDSVFETYGQMNRWQLVRLLHDSGFCPEWEDPQGSSYPIQIRSLLMKNGKTKEETDAILKRLEEVDDLHTITERLV